MKNIIKIKVRQAYAQLKASFLEYWKDFEASMIRGSEIEDRMREAKGRHMDIFFYPGAVRPQHLRRWD